MPRHIGIVGCSAEGAALCYKTICNEAPGFLGEHAHPEVSTHTHSLADYVTCLNRNDLEGVGKLMLSSAQKLESIGAEVLICPDNTIHQAFSYVAERSAASWLHIAKIVTDAACDRGFHRLGLLGTRWLVESDVYPAVLEAQGLEYVRPALADRLRVSNIIMDELVCGVQRPEAIEALQMVISRLAECGCDAVVLGCTELPLVLSDSNSPLPTLDSTRLLARAALRVALA
jgi:aspartate racemase